MDYLFFSFLMKLKKIESPSAKKIDTITFLLKAD